MIPGSGEQISEFDDKSQAISLRDYVLTLPSDGPVAPSLRYRALQLLVEDITINVKGLPHECSPQTTKILQSLRLLEQAIVKEFGDHITASPDDTDKNDSDKNVMPEQDLENSFVQAASDGDKSQDRHCNTYEQRPSAKAHLKRIRDWDPILWDSERFSSADIEIGMPELDTAHEAVENGRLQCKEDMPELDTAYAAVETGGLQCTEGTINGSSSGQVETESIMQFTTTMFYATEGEDREMIVDVMRLGSADIRCSCQYHTEDLSAQAGKKYFAKSGTVEFAAGETLQSIRITIIDDDNWDATLEFKIVLSQPEGAKLGKYLYSCRVLIIDTDVFPTNRFAVRIRKTASEGEFQLADFSLMKEYFKMNSTNSIVWKGSLKMVIYGQVKNFYFILQLMITKELFDKLLNKCTGGGQVLWIADCPEQGDTQTASRLLVILCLLFILPFAFVHYFDYRSKFWKIGGSSRKTLQANLLRKFLNYDEESRSQLKLSELMMAMNRDSFDLAADGYMQLFPLVWAGTRLVFVVALQLAMQTYIAILPVLLFPLILMTYLQVRSAKTRRLLKARNVAQNDLVSHVERTANNYRMIADYAMRPSAVDEFEKLIGVFNNSNAKANAARANNEIVAKWLTVIATGVWFIVGGNMVISGSQSLGAFLTTLGIFKDVGKSWAIIYEILLTVQGALVPLARITTLMNMPTDLKHRKNVNRLRRKIGEASRQEARRTVHLVQNFKGKFAADMVPIKLNNVAYQHNSTMFKIDPIKDCNVEFRQGCFVLVLGQPGKGKATFLKLIGGVLFPTEGVVAIPPHLRVLHISQSPVLFQGTLLTNLTYGLKKGDEDAGKERVLNICKRLKVSDHLYSHLDADELDDVSVRWNDLLALTQRALLNLARALVNNPEVLVLHKPTQYLNEELNRNTFEVLREFVQEKGLEQDPKGFDLRRPRTCIATTAISSGMSAADHIFEIMGDRVMEVGKTLSGERKKTLALGHK